MNVTKPLKRRMKIKREGGTWSWINFKYERLATFCFVCGLLGHSERDCSIVYANPGKEIDKAYGTWLRAPGRNTKVNIGARWLRNGGGGQQWTGDASRANFSGADREDIGTRFQEIDGTVSEYYGDQGEITVMAKNQERQIISKGNSNMADLENEGNKETNVAFDNKRRRMEEIEKINEDGPSNMLTDGPVHVGENEKNQEESIPKNLQMAGSGLQARLGL